MTSGLIPEFNLLVTNLYAPAGTRIPMNQAAPPLGWTQDTSVTMNDTSMRLVNTSGGATGGSTVWSQWNFGGTFNVNGFGLSVAQLPAHNHGINDGGHSHSDSGHAHGFANTVLTDTGGGTIAAGSATFGLLSQTNSASAAISTNTTGITTQNTGTGSTITPNYTTPQVKYTDHIMAVKS